MLHSVLEYARTLAMDDVQDGPIWFEVLPLQTERCLDIVEVIVALDGAASLSMVQARLNVSRATLRRRLVLVAASLGMSGMYSQPTEWLRAILAALQVSPLIG